MRADARQRREQLLEAACHLFTAHEPDTVTLENIASEAGVGIATLYRNFPDRSDLLTAASSHLLSRLFDTLDRTLTSMENDPKAGWSQMFRTLVDNHAGTLATALAPPGPGQLSTELYRQLTAVTDQFSQILHTAQQAHLAPDDLTTGELMAQLLVLTRPPIPGAILLDPDVPHTVVNRYVHGLQAAAEKDAAGTGTTVA